MTFTKSDAVNYMNSTVKSQWVFFRNVEFTDKQSLVYVTSQIKIN